MPPSYHQQLLAELDFTPPKGYLDYLLTVESSHEFGGAYLVAEHELLRYNEDHEAATVYPGYFLIGSDAGGEAFAVEKATGKFVQLPFNGLAEEAPVILGLTWPEFLDYLRTAYD